MHFIRWCDVIKSKSTKGLGFRQLEIEKVDIIGKQQRKFGEEKEAL